MLYTHSTWWRRKFISSHIFPLVANYYHVSLLPKKHLYDKTSHWAFKIVNIDFLVISE